LEPSRSNYFPKAYQLATKSQYINLWETIHIQTITANLGKWGHMQLLPNASITNMAGSKRNLLGLEGKWGQGHACVIQYDPKPVGQ
jgi:hypothetical protein